MLPGFLSPTEQGRQTCKHIISMHSFNNYLPLLHSRQWKGGVSLVGSSKPGGRGDRQVNSPWNSHGGSTVTVGAPHPALPVEGVPRQSDSQQPGHTRSCRRGDVWGHQHQLSQSCSAGPRSQRQRTRKTDTQMYPGGSPAQPSNRVVSEAGWKGLSSSTNSPPVWSTREPCFRAKSK